MQSLRPRLSGNARWAATAFALGATLGVGSATRAAVLSHPTLHTYRMPGPTSYVTAASDGNMYVAAGNDLVKMSRGGAILAIYALPATVDQLTPLGSSLYFTYAAGMVLATVPDAGGTIRTVVAGLPAALGALTTGPDGNLWGGATGLIFRAQPDGQLVEYSIPITPNAPSAIRALESDYGAIWYTNPSTIKIGTITTTGADKEFGPLEAAPNGIARGPQNSLWFTEPSNGVIGRITTAGAITQLRTSIPSPTDIVAGPDGNLWVTGTRTVARMTPAGSLTFFPGGQSNRGIAVGSDDASIWYATGTNSIDVLR